MLNSYDYSRFAPRRLTRTIHRKALKQLPELNALPHVLMAGTKYETPVLKKEGTAAIFAPFGQGALTAKSEWDMVDNETFGIDRRVESNLRAEKETDAEALLGGEKRFNKEKEVTIQDIFQRIVLQMYSGKAFEAAGFGGFPDAVTYRIDALKSEWNEGQDFVSGTDFAAGLNTKLYSVYLVYAAEAETEDAPGAKMLWGNNRTIYSVGDRQIESETGPNGGKFQIYSQHINGQAGFGFTSDVDVVEIANVPAFALDGFFLDNVLGNALTLFPNSRKANRIFIHKLCQRRAHRALQNTNRASGASSLQIVQPNETGAQSKVQTQFFDGVDFIPFVTSEVMPATGLQTIAATTQADVLESMATS